jgi:hypothetical protein
MNGITWHVCLDYVKKYIIKIETPSVFGTGIFVMESKIADVSYLNIATAYHVIKHAHEWLEPIKLTHFNTQKTIFLNPYSQDNSYSVSFVDPLHDLAIIRLHSYLLEIKEPTPNLTPPMSFIQPGFEIGWCGFPSLSAETLNSVCFFNGHISSLYNQEGDYFVDGTVINGVSGGPVFTKLNGDTIVIGLVAGYIANQQMGTSTPGLSIMRNINPIVASISQQKMQLPDKKQRASCA